MSVYQKKKIYNKNKLIKPSQVVNTKERKNSIHIIVPFELKQFLKKENNSSNNNIKSKTLKENKKKTIQEFLNRQTNYINKTKENKEKLKNIYNQDLNNLNNIKKTIPLSTILTHYYDGINKHYLHKELLYYKYYSDYNNENTFTQKKSNRIFYDLVNNIFNKIFKILDSDEDNVISPITISNTIKNIPEKIRKILRNFFDDFQVNNITLTKEYFIEIMNELYNELEINEKKILIEEYGEKKSQQNFTQKYFDDYKPRINKRSRSIAGQYENKIISEMKRRNLFNHKIYSKRDKEKKNLYFKKFNRSNSSKSISNSSSLNFLNKYTFDNFKNSIVYY